MKTSLYILLLLSSTILFAQNCELPINEAGNFEFVEVVELGQYSKSEIYNAALLSLTEYAANPSKLTNFRDKEIGAFASEWEVNVQSALGLENLFFFNIKVEIKEGKYRMTINYIDNLFFVGTETRCTCANNIAYDVCGASMCLVPKKMWNRLRCEAVKILDETLLEYQATVKSNLQNQDW